jgi:hypothetical protein
MKASLSAGRPKGQPHADSLPRLTWAATPSDTLHRRRCRLELELISRGIDSPEQAADLLLRQREAGQ